MMTSVMGKAGFKELKEEVTRSINEPGGSTLFEDLFYTSWKYGQLEFKNM
jgi:hypothetical protein